MFKNLLLNIWDSECLRLQVLRFLGSFLSKVRFFGSFLSKVGTSGLLGMRLSYWRAVWVIGDAFELLGTVGSVSAKVGSSL